MRWIGGLVFATVGVGLAAAGYYYGPGLLNQKPEESAEAEEAAIPAAKAEGGAIVLEPAAVEAIGIRVEPAGSQVEPIALPLLGTTEYDLNRMTKVRPRYDCLIRAVHAVPGQTVKKGDVLVDLSSTELDEAKTKYEIALAQWQYDHRMVEIRRDLAKSDSIAMKTLRETENSEKKSAAELDVARDKLMVFGMTEAEIENIAKETGGDKPKAVLRSPADGLVIARDAVPGNLYTETDTLLTIAPLEHLWVKGNVYENDLPRIRIGLPWVIQFPFQGETIRAKVEAITSRLDPRTRTVEIRTVIPNPNQKYKADMLVSGHVELPPAPGRVVIPRDAVVVRDGGSYAFVRREGSTPSFERRAVAPIYESSRRAVLGTGIRPGEQVVVRGALLLDQIHASLSMTDDGRALAAGPKLLDEDDRDGDAN